LLALNRNGRPRIPGQAKDSAAPTVGVRNNRNFDEPIALVDGVTFEYRGCWAGRAQGGLIDKHAQAIE
jgi:hypothetical protein